MTTTEPNSSIEAAENILIQANRIRSLTTALSDGALDEISDTDRYNLMWIIHDMATKIAGESKTLMK